MPQAGLLYVLISSPNHFHLPHTKTEQCMASSNKDPRELIDEVLRLRHWPQASAMLAELWRQQPVMGNAAYIISRYERMSSELSMTPYRLALLRSFTVEPLPPAIAAPAAPR